MDFIQIDLKVDIFVQLYSDVGADDGGDVFITGRDIHACLYRGKGICER